jgi:co-chaperonin GroES (HSP10)
MRGDELAGGSQRGAAFKVEGGDEFEHNLKTLTRTQFMDRYDIPVEKYQELITALRAGAKLQVIPRAQEPGPIAAQAAAAPAKVTVPEVKKVRYEGDCRGDNVLVTRVEREHSSQFIIPDSAKAKSDIGMVVGIGPKVERCKKGELVLFDRFAAHGKEIELVDENGAARMHLLLMDCDILLGLKKLTPQLEPS